MGRGKGPRRRIPQKAALKLHLCFDVLTGRFQQFHITDGMTADSSAAKAADPLPHGSLRLADLAYFSLDTLEKLTQDGIYWISRLKANSYLSDETGEPLDENMLRETEEGHPHPQAHPYREKKATSGVSSSLKDFLKQKRINADAPSDTVPNAKPKPPQKRFYDLQDGTLYYQY